MSNYLMIVPVAFLVAYSQLMVKHRAISIHVESGAPWMQSIFRYMSDSCIASAYAAALVASFAWLFVVTRMSLTIAFPVYIGLTFVLVTLGSWLFLGEGVVPARVLAMVLILAGISLGLLSNGG